MECKPKHKNEKRIRTSGAGALLGMVTGGLLAIPYVWIVFIICAILGAIIGDLIEYLQEEARHERRYKKEA